MPLDKQCRKCSKKESQSDFMFASVYGLCNECHTAFLPYLHKELQRFIGTSKRKKRSISLEEKTAFVKKHYKLITKGSKYSSRVAINKIAELARQELGYAESTVPCDILRALEKATITIADATQGMRRGEERKTAPEYKRHSGD